MQSKLAVCEGYSNIFKELCIAAGLESEKVSGYAKGYGYIEKKSFTRTNHAWNVVKIDNQWRIFDVTWASGYGKNVDGKMVSISEFDEKWFDIEPKIAIFSHLPEDPKWQLISNTLTLKQFEKCPEITHLIFEYKKLGGNINKIYEDAYNGRLLKLINLKECAVSMDLFQIPYNLYLYGDSQVSFKIQSEKAIGFFLIEDNGAKQYFLKEKDTFSIDYIPKGKSLTVNVIVENNHGQYNDEILEYQIYYRGNKKVQNTNTKIFKPIERTGFYSGAHESL